NLLREKGDLSGAMAAYRRAIAVQPDHHLAHWNLGQLLQKQGEFRESLKELRLSQKVGPQDPRWTNFTAKGVKECERLIELDEKLPRFIEDKITPANSAERIELARLCTIKSLHRAAARFYEDAFTKEPQLADDLAAYNRYNAACEAALAGC